MNEFLDFIMIILSIKGLRRIINKWQVRAILELSGGF